MVRDVFFIDVSDAEKNVDLGALMHPPQNKEGPDAELIGPVPGQREHRRGGGYDCEFMVERHLDGVAEMRETGTAFRAGLFARPGDVTHIETNFLPTPGEQTRGECDIKTGQACVGTADLQPIKGQY